jgi:hypothetical protein
VRAGADPIQAARDCYGSVRVARKCSGSGSDCETAGKRSRFFPAEFLYAGLELRPALGTARRQPRSCGRCHGVGAALNHLLAVRFSQ